MSAVFVCVFFIVETNKTSAESFVKNSTNCLPAIPFIWNSQREFGERDIPHWGSARRYCLVLHLQRLVYEQDWIEILWMERQFAIARRCAWEAKKAAWDFCRRCERLTSNGRKSKGTSCNKYKVPQQAGWWSFSDGVANFRRSDVLQQRLFRFTKAIFQFRKPFSKRTATSVKISTLIAYKMYVVLLIFSKKHKA